MASAARLHILEQGEDPATFAMVAFGGAGPVHAHRIASALGIREVIYPLNAGVASAFGLAGGADGQQLRPDLQSSARPDRLDTVQRHLRGHGSAARRQAFGRETTADIAFTHSIDFRYVGQGFEVICRRSQAAHTPEVERATLERAHARRVRAPVRPRRRRASRSKSSICACLRAPTARAARSISSACRCGRRPAQKGQRPAYFDEARRLSRHRVYDRHQPRSRAPRSTGPRIIEETDTTIIVPPGASGAHRCIPQRHRDACSAASGLSQEHET